MFTVLNALAQKSTLMITLTAEGDQLRVGITAAPSDSKSTPPIRPLSLVGTPAELDVDFLNALEIWQRPKKQSVLEQAQAASSDINDEEETVPAKPVTSKPTTEKQTRKSEKKKPANAAAAKSAAPKASAKSKTEPGWPLPTPGAPDAPADPVATQEPEALQDPAPTPAPDFAPEAPEVPTGAPVANVATAASEAAAEPPAKDDFTLELF